MAARRLRAWIRVCWLWSMMNTAGTAAQNAPVPPRSQNDFVQTQEFKIAGTVVNAVTGALLERVRVSMANTRARNQRTEMVTGAGGHFEFTGGPAGKYSLEGTRRGYLTSFYEQHEQYSTAIVTGPEFATDKLVLRLMPMGVISGHVLDESGEPARNAQVQLFLENHSAGMSRVMAVVQDYLDMGVPNVWILDASNQRAYIADSAGLRIVTERIGTTDGRVILELAQVFG